MTRTKILASASEIISGARAVSYGDAGRLHSNIGLAWTAILRQRGLMPDDKTMDAEAVLLCMSALKGIREAGSHSADNCMDGAGYFALAGEVAAGRS